MTKAPLKAGRSGVFRASPKLDQLRAALALHDSAWLEVDLLQTRTKHELLERLAAACGFPATFGRNWDALADALQDMSWRPARAYILHLRHAAAAAEALGRDWQTLLEVLSASAMYWKVHGKPFVVFVDDAPELPPWT